MDDLGEKAAAIAPTYAELRPFRSAKTRGIPVYDDLTSRLVSAEQPDDVVRHLMAIAAGYAYSEPDTLAQMMTRAGLERCRVAMAAQTVDAMFIDSTGFVIQSEDGRVAIVAYRGTQPVNILSWLTDLDIDPQVVTYDVDGDGKPESYELHAGFYRNVRMTRHSILGMLQRAVDGHPIVGAAIAGTGPLRPLERLYITGHSLGGAMAAILTVMIRTNPDYRPLSELLAATYTFGQPMIAKPDFAQAVAASGIADSFFRYIYASDAVPAVPPIGTGKFAHFGHEFRCRKRIGSGDLEWHASAKPMGQSTPIGFGLAFTALFTRQVTRLRNLPLRSIDDHMPHHYIAALAPAGVRSEFGD